MPRDSKGRFIAGIEIDVRDRGALSYFRRMAGSFGFVESAAKKAGKGVSAMTVAGGNLISAGAIKGLGLAKDGLLSAANEAIEFESAMADVKKVLSDEDLKNFDSISKGAKDLAQNIGLAPGEVAKLTASLAQSGIAGDELLKTAEDATKLAVAFDIGGEESGQALAKLRTGLGLSRDEVNSLTGTVNVLSNNLAATAPEILDAVKRVGAVGKAANLSGQTIAALSTAMIASGAGAEVAATGTQNFIRAIAAGGAATKRQQAAFSALKLNPKKVAKELVKGGVEAEAMIKDIVTRIGKLRPDKRLPVLIELFGAESIGAIGPLATNIELLTRSFDLAGDRIAAAGSVESEFAARSKTTAQSLAKLKASAQVLGIELGDALLPHINEAADFLTSPEGKEWGRKAVEGLTSAIRETVVVGKQLLPVVLDIVKGASSLIDKLGTTGTVALLATPKILGMAAAFSGPVGLGVAAVAAGAALGALTTSAALDWIDDWNRSLEDSAENLRDVAKGVAAGFGPLDEWTKRIMLQTNSAEESTRRFARLMLELQGGDVAGFDRRERDVKAELEQRQKSDALAAARDAEWSARLARKQQEAAAAGTSSFAASIWSPAAQGRPQVAQGGPLLRGDEMPTSAPGKLDGELKVTVEGAVAKTELKQRGENTNFRVKMTGRQTP